VNPGPILALPMLSLGPVQVTQIQHSTWSVTSSPSVKHLALQYNESSWNSFMVQYSRQPGGSSYSLSGVLSIKNPNLLEPLILTKISVDLDLPGGSGPGFSPDASTPGLSQDSSVGFSHEGQAVVNCPRDQSGAVAVEGQMVGSGVLECTWELSVPSASPLGHSLLEAAGHSSSSTSSASSISGVQLFATAVTVEGKEAASVPVPLGTAVAAGSSTASSTGQTGVSPRHEGKCAALSATFQEGAAAGARLLNPASHSPLSPNSQPARRLKPTVATASTQHRSTRASGQAHAAASTAGGHHQGRPHRVAGAQQQQDGMQAVQQRLLLQVQPQEQEQQQRQLQDQQQQQHKGRSLQQLPDRVSSSKLPGAGGGGEAADVVCDTTTLNYGTHIGPLGPGACGHFKVSTAALNALNTAGASPKPPGL
jgi:hypothetical protein